MAEQTALIEPLRERIRELEARRAKDSHNSSRPPSSDSPLKKPPPRSQRQPSGRKPNGQPGRRGATRSLVDHPDQCVIIPLTGACACGRYGTRIAATVLAERRQVVEVEVHKVHRVSHCRRNLCLWAHATQHVSCRDGPSVLAFAVYMTQYQLLPYQHTAGVLNELAGLGISPSTLQRAVRVAATRLEALVNRDSPRTRRRASGPCRRNRPGVNGNLYWLHVLSTDRLTASFPHPKRGAEAPDAFGLLAPFAGVLVHDHWSACQRYSCWHAFCNAHHLREPTAIAERSPSQPWATDMIALMITLLCQANALVGEAQDLETLPASNVEHLRTRYDTILTEAEAEAEAGNPPHPRRPGTRGRVKQSPAYNLIRRLREHRNEVLRFLTDLYVPFDTRPAKAQTQAESLRLFPLRNRWRCLCRHPLLLFGLPQTVRRSFQLAHPDIIMG